MACGVNPRGYHSINFGSFVPKSSFRVKQQLTAARRDAETGGAADSEDFKGSRRISGFSLPEIKVKKLLDNTKKKKHSRSHTHDGASSDNLRLPSISVRTKATRAQVEDARDVNNHYSREKRVVKNGDPWWKWPNNKNKGERSRYPQGYECDGSAQIWTRQEDNSNCANHHLRQRLPPLVGYRDDSGKVLFSEMRDSFKDKSSRTKDRHGESGLYLNRRYYYSMSRDGIRPCIPGAKVTMSHACLFDLGGNKAHSNETEFNSHRDHVLNSMQEELQAVPGLSSNNGFFGAHLSTLNSQMGTKLKQSLTKWQAGNDMKRQPATEGKSSTSLAQEEVAVLPRKNKIQHTMVEVNVNDGLTEPGSKEQVATFSQTKRMTQRNLRALAILEELIDVLSTTEYTQGGKYVYGPRLADLARSQPTVTQINVGDFFQKPKADIKRYDHFKELLSNVHNAQQHRKSLNAIAEELEESQEERDKHGLTQLLAIQPLQTGSECNMSSSDRTNTSKPTVPYLCRDEVKTDQLSDQRKLKIECNSVPESSNPKLMHIDLNSQYLEFSQGIHKRSKPTGQTKTGIVQSSFNKEKRKIESCNEDPKLMCINLNEQYLEFSQGKYKRSRKSHTDPNKLLRNVSKLLEVEVVDRADNPRPDLEISGENLKHLYSLGYFEGDQELRDIAKSATGRVTINQDQFRKLQEIYDHVTTRDTTIQDPDGIDQMMTEGLSGYGCLPEIKVANLGIEDESIHYDKGEYSQQDTLSNVEKLEGKALCESDSIDVDGHHHRSEGVEIASNAEIKGESLESQYRPVYGSHDEQSSELSESEIKAKEMEMERQQKLMIKQRMKEERVLKSVRRDLKYFQETLNMSGSPEKQPQKQRESLLPPPAPPGKRRKASPSRTPVRKRNQQLGSENSVNRDDIDGSKDIISETISKESGYSDKVLRESDGHLTDDENFAKFSSGDSCEDGEGTRGEGEEIGSHNYDRYLEMEDGIYDGSSHTLEEEGSVSGDSEVEDSHLITDAKLSSRTRLSSKSGLSSVGTKLEGEMGDVQNTSISNLRAGYEQSAKSLSRTNTGSSARRTLTLVNMDPLSRSDTGTPAMSESRANSRGIGGSSLPRSRKGKRQQSSKSNNNLSGLSVSRPETVKPMEIEQREQNGSRQGSRLPTREKLSSRGRVVIADSSQLMAHRKAQLTKQQLVETKKRDALLKEERREKKLEKIIRQIEFEEQMSGELEKEQNEIRRQRQLRAEERKKSEELEAQRQLLVNQMLQQEAEREAQEKARHSAMLDMLRREADMRQQALLHEKAVLEEYQKTIDVWNDWEYAYIDYTMGENFSQLARKADQMRELEAKQLLQQRMMEAFEYKRRELLEKLKTAQKQLMQDMAMDQGQLDHFLKISRAFVFTYFERVPDQTYMVPQEILM